MKKDMYNCLEGKILKLVEDLNNNLTLLERFKRKEYHASVPGKEEFNNHGESIDISYTTNAIRKQYFSHPIIALIRKGEDSGLDGIIYDPDKKAYRLLREMVHSFAHKYNLPTGDLL